jgi:hypothetical protein
VNTCLVESVLYRNDADVTAEHDIRIAEQIAGAAEFGGKSQRCKRPRPCHPEVSRFRRRRWRASFAHLATFETTNQT